MQMDKESLEAQKAHAEKEISQLENRQKILLNRIRKEERNAREASGHGVQRLPAGLGCNPNKHFRKAKMASVATLALLAV